MMSDDSPWVLADEWVVRLEVQAAMPVGVLDGVRETVGVLLVRLVEAAETSAAVAPGRLRLDIV